MDLDSVKRLVVVVIGAAMLLLSKKLGIELDPTTALAAAGLLGAYLVQSGMKSAAVVKAAEGVKTLQDAMGQIQAAAKAAPPP